MATSVKIFKGEVGMAVSKSNQTRVVGIFTYMVQSTLAFKYSNYTYNIPKLLLLFLHSLPDHQLVVSRAQR